MAARCGHSDQTGGEGQQQSVAGPVQRQRQELTGLRRVLATPVFRQEAEGEEPAEVGQRTLTSLCDGVKGLICWCFKSSSMNGNNIQTLEFPLELCG